MRSVRGRVDIALVRIVGTCYNEDAGETWNYETLSINW